MPLYGAIICGEPLRTYQDLFISSGLIHVMVVSGAHLNLVANVLEANFSKRRIWVAAALFLYALTCLWRPPIVRALGLWLVRWWCASRSLHLKPGQCVLLSICGVVLLHPHWLSSLSLLMSWIATLLLSVPGGSYRTKILVLFFGLLPLTNSLQPLSLTGVLCGAILSPILGGVLFPLCLLAHAVPWFQPFTDALWVNVLKLLSQIGGSSLYPIYDVSLPFLWLYAVALQGFVLWFESSQPSS